MKACDALSSAGQTHQTISHFEKNLSRVAHFLDKSPTTYKVSLISSHIFRAASMYAMMETFPMPISLGLMAASSLLYRASIERFCIFRFTLPSLAGGAAMWAVKSTAIALLAGKVMASSGMVLLAGVSVACLAAYFIHICRLAHNDIEKYMQKQKGCCA